MKKILIADECEKTRKLINDSLKDHGFNVLHACDGYVAKNLFEKENPRIVITAIVMPEMDGIELIGHIRKHSKSAHIIAMSGTGAKIKFDYEKTALLLGANVFFKKPLDVSKLSSYIINFLG